MERISEGERLVKLILFIKEAGPVSFAEIRERFPYEYSSKTDNDESVRRLFERDKKSLQELGIYLTVDDDKRYSLDEKRSLAAPVDLTKSQASLLRMLCGALLEDENYPFKSDLRMVLIKLSDELGIPDLLPQFGNPAFESVAKNSEPKGLAKVRKAITHRKRMFFDYTDSSGEQSAREVEPFGCFILKSNCYVVAFDTGVQEERCFRLDRMRKIRVHAASMGKPDFQERPFDASKYYGLPFQFGNEDAVARIRFDAEAAWRCDQLTMNQGVLENDGDEVIWTVPCRDFDVLAQWCIEHFPSVTLLGPPEAVEALNRGVARMLDALETQEAQR